MFTPPPYCPNPACHPTPGPGWYAKKGYYRTQYNRQPVPRYRCKTCGKWFGSHTFLATYRQHRPDANRLIGELLCSGVTMRRTAKVVRVHRRTVVRKLKFLAQRARLAHQAALTTGKFHTTYVQFDEMETYEESKLKPLSIALAVRGKNGQVLSAKVATMNCHGRMAATSVHKYQGRRPDTRKQAALAALADVAAVSKPSMTVVTDQKKAYPNLIKTALPHAVHVAHPSRRLPANSKQKDPLFWLNVTCAKLRADLARLSRRTWSASKKPECLQDALDLYIAYSNGYPAW